MRIVLFILVVFTAISCQNNGGSGAAANLDGYITENVGGGVTKAIKRNASGDVVEEGYLSGNVRNGVWLTFHEGEHAGKVKSIASYSNGILSGPYYELSNRGQIDREVNYANNQYNGRYAVYKFGRIQQESHYKDNQLDGVYREFSSRGDLQKEINYKNGKQHGKMRYYNEEGQVTVEYDYKNGEKVSGGMVETPASDEG
ncbi:MAG: hypothetical protein HKN09_05580 [Saprospiraceae bacterium]|nr:hypothetical protein [Saprospiraceae bacterium]